MVILVGSNIYWLKRKKCSPWGVLLSSGWIGNNETGKALAFPFDFRVLEFATGLPRRCRAYVSRSALLAL